MSFSMEPGAPRRQPSIHARGNLYRALATGKRVFNRVFFNPDGLGSQLEDLFVEVWRQERREAQFERDHPFTCAVIREGSGRKLFVA